MIDQSKPEPAPADPFLATADGARLAAYDELGAVGPMHRVRFPRGDEGWLITGYDLARSVLSDPRFVKGGPSRSAMQGRLPDDVVAALQNHLLSLNPPEHTRVRRLLAAAFTRRRSEQLAPRIQELTDELLDQLERRLAAGGTVDLIAEFAYPLPITVLCELLGIPLVDRRSFRAWTAPLVNITMHGFDAYGEAATAMFAYIQDLLARKRQEPADDLLSALIAARDDDGDRLTQDELTSMVFLLLLAGHETTVNLIANGVRALLLHPHQRAVLLAEPDRIAAAVEELLRYDSPLQTAMAMYASEAATIAGNEVAAGETVVVSLLAANRDQRRLPGADQLDLTRPEVAHLAFGHGIHRCVGAPLAQVEGRIAIGSLIHRFERLQLAVPATQLARTPATLMNSLVELPVIGQARREPSLRCT